MRLSYSMGPQAFGYNRPVGSPDPPGGRTAANAP